MKKNPGWKLDLDVIELVQEARVALGLQGNGDVIARWAREWKSVHDAVQPTIGGERIEEKPVSYQATEESVVPKLPRRAEFPIIDAKGDLVEEKPMAARVETPYQIARRIKLEELRAQLAGGDAGVPDPVSELSKSGAADPLTLPFDVLVNGERHQVVEFKGRRVLQMVVDGAPPILMKNLTPQETVIYWNDRTK